MKIAGTNNMAVGIMLGLVSECFIIDEGYSGSSLKPYPVHKISIVPFVQEMCRDTSLWGQLFDFEVITGSVSNLSISFLT